MALVSVDIPTASVGRIKIAVQRFGTQLVPNAVPAGKVPADWTNAEMMVVLQAMLKKFVIDLVKQVEAETAVEAARTAAITKVDADNLVV